MEGSCRWFGLQLRVARFNPQLVEFANAPGLAEPRSPEEGAAVKPRGALLTRGAVRRVPGARHCNRGGVGTSRRFEPFSGTP